MFHPIDLCVCVCLFVSLSNRCLLSVNHATDDDSSQVRRVSSTPQVNAIHCYHMHVCLSITVQGDHSPLNGI